MPDSRNLLKYFLEAGELKRVKRSGWWAAKVKDPESVAEHSWRTAVIAFALARMEGKNAEKIALYAVLHDLPEARTTDLHKVAACYLNAEKAEEQARKDQNALLPAKVRAGLPKLSRKEFVVFKDADYLECALQAREYYDSGYKDAWDWIERVGLVLQTKTAKKLWRQLKNKKKALCWWTDLKKNIFELKYSDYKQKN